MAEGELQHFLVMARGANMATVLVRSATRVWRSSLNMNARTPFVVMSHFSAADRPFSEKVKDLVPATGVGKAARWNAVEVANM